MLALTDGLRWAEEVDPVALALVSGADGSLRCGTSWPCSPPRSTRRKPVLAAMATPVVTHLVERRVPVARLWPNS